MAHAAALSDPGSLDADTADQHPSSLPEEVQTAFDYMPATLAGLIVGVSLISMLFWAFTPPQVMLGWIGAFAMLWFARLAMWRRFLSTRIETHAEWLHWRLVWNTATLVSATLWGATAWIFYFRGGNIQQTGLIIIVYTYCIAVVPVLATQPKMFLSFVALVFIPLIARIASGGTVYHYQLSGMLLVIIVLTTTLAANYRQALSRVIELKLHADELLAQLRVEKQAADDARREAEVANRAKTQFFTAASHDLRQPLHAMGLFAEALRQRTHEPEVAQLVNSINASVDALEGLFSELLDITRIDTGGVEVHPQNLRMDDILRKIRLHYEPTAFEKGLDLRLRGGARVVYGDPLLIERIVRNLVSNAIRYTNDGSVLVACRARGDKVWVQVWDTGLGIRADEQAKIFEEFYQVPNTAVIAPHQRKGLGLGLAIVKRLADLMSAPIGLRSTPGKGTVFTLELPAGSAPRPAAQAQPARAPLGLTLADKLVVIVEDEPAVRGGIEVLLEGWGAEVMSFDSVATCRAWAQTIDPADVKPDLAIVDYRLEVGTNGVDAVLALRERFGAVPAIVVTGSTMTGHEKEAQEHDFHVLIKPVVPNKLRAMIAFKLGVKAGPT